MILHHKKIYPNVAGLRIRIVFEPGTDISFLSSVPLEIKRPDGSMLNVLATQENNSLVYVTSSADLPLVGLYSVQPIFTLPPSFRGRAETVWLEVSKPHS